MSRLRLYHSLLLLLVLVPAATRAQAGESAVLTGTVVNEETGRPLANVNVFIAGSMMGTASNGAGQFRLEVPLGAHTLYVSHVGFESIQRDTLFHRAGRYRFELELTPVVLQLPEVSVGPDREEDWYDNLEKFERLFIGETANAERCSLLNPEVLRFEDTWWGKLTARAARPLIVENRALGYRIKYFLEDFEYTGGELRFHGEPLFEELAPADSQQAARWRQNRRRAYYGSVEHFLQAAVDGRVKDAGFATYIQPEGREGLWTSTGVPYDPKHLLEASDRANTYRLTVPWMVQVIYTRERETRAYLQWSGKADRPGKSQRSWFELTDGPVLVDRRGETVEPYGLTVYGYFAFERMAEALPKEYRPNRDEMAVER